MKFPALVIAVLAAAGILAAAPLAAHLPHALLFFLALALGFLLCGCALLKLGRLNLAWLASLAAWFFLSAAAAQCALLDRPPDLASQLVETGRLDLSEPLRWRGILSADPLRLPWGLRYDLDLEQVQTAGTWIASHGGMRVSYFYEGRAAHEPVPLRAGDRAELLVRARLVRNFGDPGSFDYRTFLARQGIYLTASLRSSELMQQLPSATPRLRQRIARLRGRLLNDLDAMFSGSANGAAVARAMLLGDRNFLDRQQVESFQQTGAYHVLVVAGLHVGVLVVVLLWIGRKLRLGILARALVTIAVLVCYVGIVEDRPPILRAALMATLYLLGRMAYRRIDFLNATGVAALAILLVNPAEIRDASFQLSFLAVGIVGGISAPLLERTAERYRRALDHLGDVTRDGNHAPRVTEFRLDLRAVANWLGTHLPHRLAHRTHEIVAFPLRMVIRIWELAVISLCMQFGMLPLMAAYFHRVSLAAPLANIPAVLLTGIIVPFGFAALSIHAIWRGLGSALGYALGFLIAALTGSVNWFARAHWVSFRVPTPPLLLTFGFLTAMVLLSAAILSKRRWASWTSCMAAIVLAGLIADYPFPPRLEGGRLEVTTLDVGQGDAIFVAFPDGRTMLVDGGGLPGSSYIRGIRPGIDVGEDVVSPYLWARGLKRIDVVVLTHAHQDHLGGLPAVLRNFRVGQLWVGRDVESAAYRALLEQAKSRGVPIIHRVKGDAFEWAGVRGRVLWPATDDTASAPSNNDSVVLRLEDGNDSLLLAGDIERSVERGILGDQAPLASEFLKVPHHGSRTSTTQPFLDAVHPRFAAISVGEANAFGHPNREVIDRISAEGARLLRTDRDGAITVVTDGQRLEMRSFWSCSSAPCAENASSPEAVPYALGSRE
jgi:competence protein ComEC